MKSKEPTPQYKREIEQLIEAGFAGVARVAGAVGGAISGGALGAAAGAYGASKGTQMGLRGCKLDSETETINTTLSAKECEKKSREIFSASGFEVTLTDFSNKPYVAFITNVGGLASSPTVVCVEFNENEASGSEVTVTGFAKEGLIKMHTARKAINAFKEAFSAE